ncbi:MAG: DUF5131 family protein [Roseateles sp.]
MDDTRRRVFCNSLGDWLDNQVPIATFVDFLDLVRVTDRLLWLLLSKRIGALKFRLAQALSFVQDCHDRRDLAHWIVNWLDGDHPPTNVLVGATVVDQAEADRDIPKLLAVPAAARFLSVEPMLGPISFEGMFASAVLNDGTNVLEALDWVICGGESGAQARPMHPDWARSLRDQCESAGVPFLFKQWGEWAEEDTGLPQPLVAREGDPEFDAEMARHDGFISLAGHFVLDPDQMADGVPYRGLVRPGKKGAGRLLDGIEHNGFPELLR